MKKVFESPALEVEFFATEDIISTSTVIWTEPDEEGNLEAGWDMGSWNN